MEETFQYAAGIDVGTEEIKVVLLGMGKEGAYSVSGYGKLQNAGMSKGTVVNLSGPSEKVDRLLGEVERMSGKEINSAMISVNGAQILSTKVDGMIMIPEGHTISENDLIRANDSAITGRIPQNRQILAMMPLEYVLDGQTGIKDPIGMIGTRLVVKNLVLSTLVPNYENLKKSMEAGQVKVLGMMPSVVAGGKAVLDERQKENGVAVVDLGATTTGVAVFEEGELQYVGVVPMGSNNITKDLAIVLEIDMEMAEEVKRRFANGNLDLGEKEEKNVVLKKGKEEIVLERKMINEVVGARLREIFEGVRKELRRAEYDRRLPEGVVLVGGGAKMKNIEIFAKEVLGSAIKIGEPRKLSGAVVEVMRPEYAGAVGLAMEVREKESGSEIEKREIKKKDNSKGFWAGLSKIFGKF